MTGSRTSARPVSMVISRTGALCIVLFLLQGCVRTVTTQELPVSLPGKLSETEALDYLVSNINATQYGIALQRRQRHEKKVFPYQDLFFKLEKHDIRKELIMPDWDRFDRHVNTVFVILVTSTCGATDGPADYYSRYYYFDRGNAERVARALVSMGARLCGHGP